MLVDADSYPDLLTVLNADDVTEFSLGVQTSSNGLPWIFPMFVLHRAPVIPMAAARWTSAIC